MSDVVIRPVIPTGPALGFDLVGDDVLTGQVGGWESLPRARRTAAAGWVGTPETTYELTVMVDGLGTGRTSDRSVERECRLVESWGLPTKTTAEPPVLSITGLVLVAPRTRWVLQSIALGERIRSARGFRVQQTMTLSFLQYVEPRLVKSPAKRARDRRGLGKGPGKGPGKGKN